MLISHRFLQRCLKQTYGSSTIDQRECAVGEHGLPRTETRSAYESQGLMWSKFYSIMTLVKPRIETWWKDLWYPSAGCCHLRQFYLR